MNLQVDICVKDIDNFYQLFSLALLVGCCEHSNGPLIISWLGTIKLSIVYQELNNIVKFAPDDPSEQLQYLGNKTVPDQ